MSTQKTMMPTKDTALAGRSQAIAIAKAHYVLDRSMTAPFPENTKSALLGMGCFWGAERRIWQQPNIYTTAVGYAGGFTPNPSYEEVCSGQTGHTEVVLVVYENQDKVFENLLKVFWESHDPTQGMRQGNDIGTQYRSAIYVFDDDQMDAATRSQASYQQALSDAGLGAISTEILAAKDFYYAEDYHQQYLAKNPNGYCGLGGTGVCTLEPNSE